MFDEVRNLISSENIRQREYGKLMSIGLIDKSRERTSTRVSKSIASLNRRSQFRTGGDVFWNYSKTGHLGRNCLKLQNNKSKRIRVESTDDIATLVDSALVMMIMFYQSLRILCLRNEL